MMPVPKRTSRMGKTGRSTPRNSVTQIGVRLGLFDADQAAIGTIVARLPPGATNQPLRGNLGRLMRFWGLILAAKGFILFLRRDPSTHTPGLIGAVCSPHNHETGIGQWMSGNSRTY